MQVPNTPHLFIYINFMERKCHKSEKNGIFPAPNRAPNPGILRVKPCVASLAFTPMI